MVNRLSNSRLGAVLTGVLVSGALAGILGPSPVGARPSEHRLAPPNPPKTAGSGAEVLVDTTFFGGTTWDAVDMRWEALPGSTWTFDTGAGGTREGWTRLDLTEPDGEARARRLSSADPRWTGTPCVGSDAGLGGDWSFWIGLLQSETDTICYQGGQGYGNNWDISLARTFAYAGSTVTLEFDYVNETENDFDYTTIEVDTTGAGWWVHVLEFSGSLSGHETITLTPGIELPSQPVDSIRVRFRFTSDGGWSDEDGIFTTTCGAFAVDNITMSGIGIDYFTDFETDDGGWTVLPPEPGIGTWARLEHLDDLPPTGLPPCGLKDSVMVFFDPELEENGGHPIWQEELALSPWIDLDAAGVMDRPGRTLLFDLYSYLPLLDYVFVQFGVQWYPDTCSVSGVVQESRVLEHPFLFNFSETAICTTWALDLSEMIPPGAERVRVGIGVENICAFYLACNKSNPSPWFDNVRLAMHDFLVIQDAVDAAAPGDTVRIPAGTYSGPGNYDISFGGKNLVLLAPEGPSKTIINCQGDGRGFVFDSGEDTTSVVSGFTIGNGRADNGGGVLVGDNSGVTLENCVIKNCEATNDGGGVATAPFAANATVRIRECTLRENEAGGSGGGMQVYGDARIEDSFLLDNTAQTGGGCSIGSAPYPSTDTALLWNTVIEGNQAQTGGGIYGYRVPASFGSQWKTLVSECTVRDNHAVDDGGGRSHRQRGGRRLRLPGEHRRPRGGSVSHGRPGRELPRFRKHRELFRRRRPARAVLQSPDLHPVLEGPELRHLREHGRPGWGDRHQQHHHQPPSSRHRLRHEVHGERKQGESAGRRSLCQERSLGHGQPLHLLGELLRRRRGRDPGRG